MKNPSTGCAVIAIGFTVFMIVASTIFRNTIGTDAYIGTPVKTGSGMSAGTILLWIGGGILVVILFAKLFYLEVTPGSPGSRGEIDWTVDNLALAYDPKYGCVLVKARNTHKIDGRDKHVSGNLPGNILFFGKAKDGENLYVWDYYHQFGTMNDPVNSVGVVDRRGGFNWIPFEEPMEIVPRGARKDWQGALADEVAGWDIENYVLPKGERPSIRNPGVYTGDEVGRYMSRRRK